MRRSVVLLLAIIAGCASAETPSTAALEANDLEVQIAPLEGPLPSDAAPEVRVIVRPGEHATTLEGRHVGALVFGGAVLALGVDGTLRRFVPDAATLTSDGVAHHVSALPVISPDGAHLAYVVSADGLTGSLHVLDAMGDRVITPMLGSIGALAFAPDGASVAFVGVAATGGVAGVWIADARGIDDARCLTNCALAIGELDRAIPLPEGPLHVEHQRIHWMDRDGTAHEVPR